MKLSAPVFHLKRKAKLLSRTERIPLYTALERIAAEEGFSAWSLLVSQAAAASPAARLFDRLAPADLVLVAARPGQGKTLLALELAVEAMKAGNPAFVFSLEYTRKDVLDRFRALDVDLARFNSLFNFDSADTINADHMIAALASAPPGALAVMDYLQLLDQRRENPELSVQVSALKAFARQRGLIFVFISQIDRSYDPTAKSLPDIEDIRLPNPLDLALFDKTCFLQDGRVRFR